MLFGWYIVGYLFLAGVGSGAFLVAAACCVLDAVSRTEESARAAEAAQAGFYVAPCCMTLAAFLLLLDLGNAERALAVAATPFQSVMSAGAWLVALLTLVSGTLAATMLVRCRVPRSVGWLCCVAGGACAVGVMTYTGLLLSDMVSIDFWRSPWLVVLFVASSLSTGAAAVLGLNVVLRPGSRGIASGLWRAAGVLGAAEAAVLAVFVIAQSGYTEVAAQSCALLVGGRLAPAFWGLVCAAGLALPLACHGAQGASARPAAVAVSSAGVLSGGLALRYCIVAAALYTPYALGAPL